jgi:hypothetical protein
LGESYIFQFSVTFQHHLIYLCVITLTLFDGIKIKTKTSIYRFNISLSGNKKRKRDFFRFRIQIQNNKTCVISRIKRINNELYEKKKPFLFLNVNSMLIYYLRK